MLKTGRNARGKARKVRTHRAEMETRRYGEKKKDEDDQIPSLVA
jgi:hypothetical protein